MGAETVSHRLGQSRLIHLPFYAGEMCIRDSVYGEGDRKVIQCNIRDISERKQAERTAQQLLQSRQLEEMCIRDSIGWVFGAVV